MSDFMNLLSCSGIREVSPAIILLTSSISSARSSVLGVSMMRDLSYCAARWI